MWSPTIPSTTIGSSPPYFSGERVPKLATEAIHLVSFLLETKSIDQISQKTSVKVIVAISSHITDLQSMVTTLTSHPSDTSSSTPLIEQLAKITNAVETSQGAIQGLKNNIQTPHPMPQSFPPPMQWQLKSSYPISQKSMLPLLEWIPNPNKSSSNLHLETICLPHPKPHWPLQIGSLWWLNLSEPMPTQQSILK